MKQLRAQKMVSILILMADGDPICRRYVKEIDPEATHITWDEGEWDEHGPIILQGEIVETIRADAYACEVDYEISIQNVERIAF